MDLSESTSNQKDHGQLKLNDNFFLLLVNFSLLTVSNVLIFSIAEHFKLYAFKLKGTSSKKSINKNLRVFN